MKTKIIICLSIITALSFFSCKKNIEDLNTDTKRAETVPSYTLFSNAQRNVVDLITSANVNTNIFRLITQQWTEVTYVDESNYDLGTRAIPDNWWRAAYKTILINFKAARNLIPTDVPDADKQKNELAMLDIMEVYTWSILVNTFGNVPYTEALDPENFFPKYDDAKTVYYDLLARLDKDIADLNVSASSFGSADLLYGGDVAQWKKFANVLKLRMGITIADSDPAKSKTVVESAVAGGLFTSNADNAVFQYQPTTPNTNPVYVDLVQGGRNDFVPAKTLVDLMNTLNDPRRPQFFTQIGGVYKGGVPGIGNSYATLSHVSDKIKEPDAPATIIDYAEQEFILAEAGERGMVVGGTAALHYNNAVAASILDWGGTAAEPAAYLANPLVNYATAPGNYKQKIGTQKYIALYNRGFESWTEQRRLDFPVITAPATALSAYPVRFTYPVNEQNLNSANYTAASAAIGGDKVDTKLFWDKF
jgi:hypothetical protein